MGDTLKDFKFRKQFLNYSFLRSHKCQLHQLWFWLQIRGTLENRGLSIKDTDYLTRSSVACSSRLVIQQHDEDRPSGFPPVPATRAGAGSCRLVVARGAPGVASPHQHTRGWRQALALLHLCIKGEALPRSRPLPPHGSERSRACHPTMTPGAQDRSPQCMLLFCGDCFEL